jgi:diguanylate cyclase (GGDEF)-like protein
MFGAPAALVDFRMAQLGLEARATIARLGAKSPVPALADVEDALERSVASGDAVMELMDRMATQRGRAAIGRALAGNDPALNRMLVEAQDSSAAMSKALNDATAQYARRAARARTQATVGTALAIMLLLLAFGAEYLRSLRARSVAERLAAENARLALMDPLTDLANRRAFAADVEEALAGAAREPAVLALFDLDGFKQYNDTFGHQAGDELLRRLAGRLTERIEGRGTAYRMGGDEFCVLAPAGADDAPVLAREAAEALAESGDGYSIGCSHGIALLPSEVATAEAALRLADGRMYAQKTERRSGRFGPDAGDALLRSLIDRDGSAR